MKKCLIAMAMFGVLIGVAFSFHRPRTAMLSAEETATRSTPDRSLEQPLPTKEVAATPEESRPSPTAANGREQTPPAATTARDAGLVFNEAIETLVSPQASFDQKQVAWKQLKERGQLDMAISELEERTANDPERAENVAALGQAYLKKCGVIQDVREQAILAMKADQTLESALSLDPSNWEARYIKTVGMSYWPPQLNKGREVIEQFQTLIQDQEAQPAQPHFARPYVWLGDQYKKADQADYAVQVWQRGAAFFPNNEELKTRLAAAP
jgi:tetratricopeptide (TPR) repeat protein